MKGNTNWDKVIVQLNGKAIEDIKVWKKAMSLSELTAQLQRAEDNEEYELCAELLKQIHKFENINDIIK